MGTDNNIIVCVWMSEVAAGASYEQTHYLSALKKIGYDARVIPIEFDYNRFPSKYMVPIDAKLLDIVDLLKPKYLLVKLYANGVQKETLRYISEKTSTTTIIICGDDEKFFERDSVPFADAFNWVLTRYKPAVKRYNALGLENVIYEGYGASPDIFKRRKVKKDLDVTFCGAVKRGRIELFNSLVLRGIKMRVYGNGWLPDDETVDGRGQPTLTTAQYVKLINQTKVNLSEAEDINDDKITLQIKGRDFEVPMAGGFLLARYNPLLSEFYKIGKEIETYKTAAECADKIRYYIIKEKEREKIAQAGWVRAHKDHSYIKQFRRILKKVGGK